MAVLVYTDGSMVQVNDADLARRGKQTLTIGEISPFIERQLVEQNLLSIGVDAPGEVPNINELLNQGLMDGIGLDGCDWVATLRRHMGAR